MFLFLLSSFKKSAFCSLRCTFAYMIRIIQQKQTKDNTAITWKTLKIKEKIAKDFI